MNGRLTVPGRLAERFEASCARLHAMAYRILGSLSEVDDALQETWLRASVAGTDDVANLDGWLTTILARVCLNMLRARSSRREEPLGARLPDAVVGRLGAADPEQETLLAESVGLAMLVVVQSLAPVEGIVFVLQDVFAVPFADIARIVDRSPAAARQIASRARRRIRGLPAVPDTDLPGQQKVVDAVLAAARGGDLARRSPP